MKQSNKCWAIYLALFLLLFLTLLPFKEGLENGHKWLDFSGWFTTSQTPTNTVTTNVSRSHGRLYNTSRQEEIDINDEDTVNPLTNTEKSYARSALNKLSNLYDDDNLNSCIKKIKGYI